MLTRFLALLLPVWAVGFASPSVAEVAVLDGANIHYAEHGDADGPALVLIHGWACNLTFWSGQVGALSQDNRVLAVDLPGHGDSDAPHRAYTQEHFAHAVAAVLDHAGAPDAILIGHSMGASVARWTAHLYPERVRALVLVDGAILPVPDAPEARAAWQQEWDGFAGLFRGPDARQNTIAFIDSLHADATPDSVRQTVREGMLATPARVRLSAMEELLTLRGMDLPPVAAPTLAIYAGSADLPPGFDADLARMFPDLEYHVWDGPGGAPLGHFIMMEQPDRLNASIAAFVNRVR